VALVFASACTTKQQNKCTSDSDCTNPAYPFCDVDGEFSTSGGAKNVCTIVPPDCPVERCGCSPGATTCTGDQLTTCDAGGTSETSTTCALGCATDGTRCLSFEPSNGLGPALTAAANEPAVTIPDGATINTDTGEVKSAGGISISVNSLAVAQGSGSIRALIGGSFSIGNVVVSGNSPLAIVSGGEIHVSGVFDISANASSSGPGAQLAGACAGQSSVSGGSGGANATDGGASGQTGSILTNPRVPGGAAQIGFEPLVGGCVGGQLTSSGAAVADGGGGGGAVQFVSLTAITVSGSIDAGGGGGGYDGGGGGSGGNVILEAPRISFSTGAVFANGGSGGACSATGNDATRDLNAAAGAGPCGSTPNIAHGGDGGTVSVAPGSGGHVLSGSSGGGGGAVGRVRIATRDGTFDAGAATLSAAVTVASLTTN
jgi:hypothetical protein